MDLQLEEEDNWELPIDSLNFLTRKSCDRKPTSVSSDIQVSLQMESEGKE